MILYIDIETYSTTDITKSGAYKYIESPDFEVLIVGYALNDGPVTVVDLAQGEELSDFFLEALHDPKCLKVAHNAVFERLSFRRIGHDVPAEQWYCTSVKAAYCGLPLSLDNVSKVLDLQDKKLEIGKSLIRYFSCPCKPTKINGGRTRNYPEHAPDKWEMYKEYNKYDVLAEREIYKLLEKYTIPESERRLYAVDQHINDRGITVDVELATAAIDIDTMYTQTLLDKATALTGLDNPNSLTQIKKWVLQKTGCEITSLAKGEIENVAEDFANYPDVLELLNLRKELSKTSVKKYYAMINCACSDNRVRGTFQFYGANRTGRWAGRLLQLQNLAKNYVSNIELPRELVRRKDLDAIEMLYGQVADILSQLIRTALIAPEGKTLAVADFAAIEARVISWLAGEQWRMDIFAGDGKIYEATGARMFGVPIESITKGSEIRGKAKISELALGFGGSVNALRRMGGEKMGLSDSEMKSLVKRWRDANPCIVYLWEDVERAAKEAVKYRRRSIAANGKLTFECDGDNLMVRLPSGRQLFYRHATIKTKPKPNVPTMTPTIWYEGVVQETKHWGEIDTYGGKLVENCVQAIARDLMASTLMSLDEAGHEVIAHIHDEVIVEVEKSSAKQKYAEIVSLMEKTPDWAKGLPLKADGYITPFYLKD
jgi:DNA polymerase